MKFPLYFFGIVFVIAGNPLAGLFLMFLGFLAAE